MSDAIKRKFFDSEWIDELLEDAVAFMKVYKECPGVEHLEFTKTIPNPFGTYEVHIKKLMEDNSMKYTNNFDVWIKNDETHECDFYTIYFDRNMEEYRIEYTDSGVLNRM